MNSAAGGKEDSQDCVSLTRRDLNDKASNHFIGGFLLAIHPSAIKRHRQSLKRRATNKEVKARIRTLLKKARQAVAAKDQDQISVRLREVSSALGKAVTKGILKRNTASRWLSRLSRSATRPTAAQ